MKKLIFFILFACFTLFLHSCLKDQISETNENLEQRTTSLFNPYVNFSSDSILISKAKLRTLDQDALEFKNDLINKITGTDFIINNGFILWDHGIKIEDSAPFVSGHSFPLYKIGDKSSNGYILCLKNTNGTFLYRLILKSDLDLSQDDLQTKSDASLIALLEFSGFLYPEAPYVIYYLNLLSQEDETVRPRSGCWILVESEEPGSFSSISSLHFYAERSETTNVWAVYWTYSNHDFGGLPFLDNYQFTEDAAKDLVDKYNLALTVKKSPAILYSWIWSWDCDDDESDFWTFPGSGGTGTTLPDNNCDASYDFRQMIWGCLGITQNGGSSDPNELDEGLDPNADQFDEETCDEFNRLSNCISSMVDGSPGSNNFSAESCAKLYEELYTHNSISLAADILCDGTNSIEITSVVGTYITYILKNSTTLTLEDWICRNNKLDLFEENYELEFSEEERIGIIEAVSGCGDGFEEEVWIEIIKDNVGDDESNATITLLKTFLDSHTDKADVLDFFNTIASLRDVDNAIRWDRSLELYDLLQNYSNNLTECGDPSNISDWSDLASFAPSANILNKLESLGEGWKLQGFQTPTAAPSINLDYFSTTITSMPINPATGNPWSPDELFQYIRININDFVDKDASEFLEEEGSWASSNPIGTILSIDINGPDNGSVICSQFEQCCWIFSTVKAPFLPGFDGFHPVSGNRMFGYKINSQGQMEIFTKGVDRFFSPKAPPFSNVLGVDEFAGYLLEKVAFAGADNLWESFQESIQSFVNSPPNQGQANINPPVIYRPKVRDELKNLLKQGQIINSIPCGN